MSSSIDHEVRRFVLTHIPSVPFMEAALMFHDKPALPRSAVEVAATLYVDERTALEILLSLCAMGLLQEADGCFQYAPRDDALADAFIKVAAAYRSDLIGMTNLIHDQTQRSAMRFADAFKFRKEA